MSAAAFLLLASSSVASADGRADWNGYAWQRIDMADCLPVGSILHCPPYHEKWDWKRNQWVDIVLELDLAGGKLHLFQRLSTRDPRDVDWVCVTAVAVDASGSNVVVHHQNWLMGPGDVTQDQFSYRSPAVGTVAAIHVGSKQCRDGAHQDDALYEQVLAGIQP